MNLLKIAFSPKKLFGVYEIVVTFAVPKFRKRYE